MEQFPKSSSVNALQGVRVLIVEDDVFLLMELEAILLEAGAEIAGRCRTVSEALVSVAKEGVSAAILDVRIGRDTIAPVARQLASRGTPFIFYTGQVESDADLAEWAGRKVLSKPARASAIVAAVANLLHHAPAGRG
jgi:DNA-binding response OmpR family regulator